MLSSRNALAAAVLVVACACGGGGGGDGGGGGAGGGGDGGSLSRTGQVSGSVGYAGSKTGRLFVALAYGESPRPEVSAGTSLSAPGPFTIRGLSSDGTATVMAWIDVLGLGRYNAATDPFGSVTVNISSGVASAGNIALSDPASATPPPPASARVNVDDGALEVVFSPSVDGRGFEVADRYTIYWSLTDAPGPADHQGKLTVPAGARRARVLGLVNGTSLHLGITASAGASESIAAAVSPSPVTVGIPVVDSTHPISGQVTLPPVAGTLVVFARNVSTSAIHLTSLEGASSPASYAIPVRDGTYELQAYLDAGGDGLIGAGEPALLDAPAARVTVAGGGVSAPALAFPATKATARVTTQVTAEPAAADHLTFEVRSGTARPVSVTVARGANVDGSLDLGVSGWPGTAPLFRRSWPLASSPSTGDAYQLAVTYDDLTTETLTATVAAVLVPPTPTAPIGASASSTPAFAWSAPPTAPAAAYQYGLNMWSPAGGASWLSTGIPSGQTSVPYDGPPLVSGRTYDWYVWLEDAAGNSASSATVSFAGP